MLRRFNGKKDEGQQRYRNNSSFNYSPMQQGNSYSGTYPLVRIKDIYCIFCKHKFYIGQHLKGYHARVPLLLPCGHSTCTFCESMHPDKPCPTCTDKPSDIEVRKTLPFNVHVIGLVHTINSAPVRVEDPDISFHIPMNAIARQNFDQGVCSECGMIADFECKNCEVSFCKLCFKKIHAKALQNHKKVPLNKNTVEFSHSNLCPYHELDMQVEASEYYCEDCDVECCSHCIIEAHAGHKSIKQFKRNKELMPDFQAAFLKLQETLARTRQTQKDLCGKMVSQKAMKESQEIEDKLTQHFIRFHGILQNLENKLKKNLVEQRTGLQRDIEEMRTVLGNQEQRLESAAVMAATAAANHGRVNIQKLTEKLLELADSPCHIIQRDDDDEAISMKIDDSVFDSVKQHIQLHVPDVPRFNLVTTDELPEDHELEPLSFDETLNFSLKWNSKTDDSSPSLSTPYLSTPSRSFSNPSPNESLTAELSSLEKGTTERVRVSHIINPTDFYVQRVNTYRILEELESDIASYIDNNTTPPEQVFLGQLYVVLSSDNKWHRGRVIRENMENGVTAYEVNYIDYGMTEYVPINKFRNNRPSFSLTMGLAIHCTLLEIAPIDVEWDDEVINQFRCMVAEQTLAMHILNINEPIFTVDLHRYTCNKNNISLREWLISTKLAKPNTYYKLQRMNPLSAQQFYYEDLPVEKYTKVQISYIESPNSIYVRKIQDADYQNHMKNFIKEYKQLLKFKDLSINHPEYGTAVALKNNDGLFDRAIITKIEKTKIQLFLIDIGSNAFVDYSCVTYLPHRFCSFNAQAIKVSLADIKPAENNDWSLDAINYLKSILENRITKILPVNRIDQLYEVVIYSDSTNINANLVSKNFAESTGKHSKHASLNKDINIVKKNRKKSSKKIKMAKNESEENGKPRTKSSKTIEESDPFKVRILINKVVSPSEIYVSEASNVNSYEQMVKEMQDFYGSHTCEWVKEPQQNLYYSVYSRKDKNFCRARFMEMTSDPTVAKMELIDLAEIEDIPISDILPLDRVFMHIPKYIFQVKVAGITPCGGSKVWQSSSCDKLKEIIHDNGDTKYYITLVDGLEADGVLPVDLFIRRNVVTGPTEPNRKETLKVARSLIEAGLALPIRGFMDSDSRELAAELKKKLKLHSAYFENTPQTSDSNITIIEAEKTLDNSGAGEEKENGTEDTDETGVLDVSSESTPLPPRLSEWIPAAHVLENSFNSLATYVDDDCGVYFHPDTKEYNDTLSYISSSLFEHYSSRSIKSYDHIWEKGELCIVCWHADKKWYRGKVVDVGRQTLKVFFVDFGNIEDCQVGTVKKRIILEEIPIQCTKASIVGIKPIGKIWREYDLDIIHKLLVSKPCKMKIVSRPPEQWAVAIWIIEGSSVYPLPWYLKNKTQVRCISEDISIHYEDDATLKYNPKPSIDVNGKNRSTSGSSKKSSSDLSESLSEDENDISSENPTNSVSIDYSRENLSDTIRHDEEFESEITMLMSKTILNNCSLSSSKKTSPNSSAVCSPSNSSKNMKHLNTDLAIHCNGKTIDDNVSYDEDDDRILSGNSINFNTYLHESFEIKSVRSEYLCEDINEENFIGSTPLSNSIQDDSYDDGPQPIDFQKYNVKSFTMGLGQAFTVTKMSGYIVKSSNRELNKWIELCNKLQEEIQSNAEELPLFKIGSAQFCIAMYDDGMWYRARILQSVTSKVKDTILVEFIDFGNCMAIDDETCIRAMKKEWMDVPCMSFHFKLSNVEAASEYYTQAQDAMNIVLGQADVYNVVITKYDPQLELEIYTDKRCKHLVYAPLLKNNYLIQQ